MKSDGSHGYTFLRVIVEDSLIWEGKEAKSLDETMQELEKAIAKECSNNNLANPLVFSTIFCVALPVT
ncbi:MAG: hypothetical protein HQM14_16470 [SAR324 cluster bacterium]|nr:hypothetical protein [SAR324 cluster bacterium]